MKDGQKRGKKTTMYNCQIYNYYNLYSEVCSVTDLG